MGMHPLDETITFEQFDLEIQKLGQLLLELGVKIDPDSDLEKQTYAAFATLYYSMFSDERPSMNRGDEIEAGAALAGLGDLAAKINRARTTPGFPQLRPHLEKMVTGAVRMNAASVVTDEAANKNSEMYVGCLALGAGLEIELEDPQKSAAGKNPDVLLKFEKEDWSIAVKAIHSTSPQTIFDNIRKGADQVERSGRPGLVFINVKNKLDHKALADASPFDSIDEATKAVGDQIDAIIRNVLGSIVPEDWAEVFCGKRVAPYVTFMGQISVSGDLMPGLPLFIPVKVIRVLVPPLTDPSCLQAGRDAAALRLIEKLNHELQRNPGSSAPIES
jgi:hypothetical protein